ncbi:MAG: PTS sugar transporter subunit IIA [Alphaproteobacteria bacterium]|nr:PTS sugar transporter subunit IIA [Alphaproteobacteria bacterium]MBQ7659144.1 PTS sugar transporter subunit IIA [Alphaproteobacteria bacterium]
MIGLVLVTHGAMAAEFLSAMQYVVGPQKQIEAVGIFPNDDIQKRRSEIQEKVQKVDAGNGVIVLTDMFGGTPSNLAISLMEKENIEVLAGLNLPMLIKLSNMRQNASLKEAARAAEDAGKKYINLASKLLGE